MATNLSSHASRRASVITWLKQHRARVFLWLRLIVAFGLMAFVIALVAGDRDKLREVDWHMVPLAFSLTLISTVVKAYRWSLLVRQSRMNVGFGRLLGTYMVGAFFNTILPSNIGGDAVRAVDTAAKTGRAADSTSSVLIERGMGMLAIVAAGSVCALLMDDDEVPILFQLAVHAMFAAGIVAIVILRQGWFMGPIVMLLRRLKMGRFAEKVQRLQEAFSVHLWQPGILLLMFGLSVIANALTMGAVYLILTAVTEPVPLLAFVPMIALITTSELIPLSPASLGVKESAYVFFLGLIGVGSASAGVIALIVRVMDWGRALIGGVVFLRRTLVAEREKRKPPDLPSSSDGRHGDGRGDSPEPLPEDSVRVPVAK